MTTVSRVRNQYYPGVFENQPGTAKINLKPRGMYVLGYSGENKFTDIGVTNGNVEVGITLNERQVMKLVKDLQVALEVMRGFRA